SGRTQRDLTVEPQIHQPGRAPAADGEGERARRVLEKQDVRRAYVREGACPDRLEAAVGRPDFDGISWANGAVGEHRGVEVEGHVAVAVLVDGGGDHLAVRDL